MADAAGATRRCRHLLGDTWRQRFSSSPSADGINHGRRRAGRQARGVTSRVSRIGSPQRVESMLPPLNPSRPGRQPSKAPCRLRATERPSECSDRCQLYSREHQLMRGNDRRSQWLSQSQESKRNRSDHPHTHENLDRRNVGWSRATVSPTLMPCSLAFRPTAALMVVRHDTGVQGGSPTQREARCGLPGVLRLCLDD